MISQFNSSPLYAVASRPASAASAASGPRENCCTRGTRKFQEVVLGTVEKFFIWYTRKVVK